MRGTGSPKDPAGPSTDSCVSLAEVPAGTHARLCGHADRKISRRLRDLGFVPDTSVLVVRSAPLGDPVELELRGFRICLRRRELDELCARLDSSRADPA